jgi:hypothetical protein
MDWLYTFCFACFALQGGNGVYALVTTTFMKSFLSLYRRLLNENIFTSIHLHNIGLGRRVPDA